MILFCSNAIITSIKRSDVLKYLICEGALASLTAGFYIRSGKVTRDIQKGDTSLRAYQKKARLAIKGLPKARICKIELQNTDFN
ncbi:MAG: hypothetical protein EBU52_00100 [Cytophagia bacterium]|nr:hypothetical protein [Cytophagia bacterium]